MAKRLILLILCVCYTNGMEMRETVERMVMVRRTGSDLQPAATGFIYRSDNHGPASVIKLGESDINQHLDNLPVAPQYEQPKAFAAPIPVAAGPFYNKEENEGKATYASERIIPVVEVKEQDSKNDADTEASSDYGDYKKDFDDYMAKYYGIYGDKDHYNENGGGSDFQEADHKAIGEKGAKGFKSGHEYGKGGAGDYYSEKYNSYAVSGTGEHNKHYDEADAYGNDYAHGQAYKGEDHGHKSDHSEGEDTDGYHKLFDKEEFKKDHEFYDEEGVKGGFHKFADGIKNYGKQAGGFKKGESHDSGHNAAGFGKNGFGHKDTEDVHNKSYKGQGGEESSHHEGGGFGKGSELFDGKSYGYEIKH